MRLDARVRKMELQMDAADTARPVLGFTEEDWFQLERSALRFHDMGSKIAPVECELFREMLEDYEMTESEFRNHIAEQTRIFEPQEMYGGVWSPVTGFTDDALERMHRWSAA